MFICGQVMWSYQVTGDADQFWERSADTPSYVSLDKQMLKTWGYISHWDYILIQPSVRGAGQIHSFIDIKAWPLALEYIMSLCFMSSVLHLKTTCYYCSYVVLLSIRISLIAKISLSHASIMTGGAILCLGEGRESTIRIPFSICVVTCG